MQSPESRPIAVAAVGPDARDEVREALGAFDVADGRLELHRRTSDGHRKRL